MTTEYFTNEELKKEYVKEILNNSKEYLKAKRIWKILVILGVAIIIGFTTFTGVALRMSPMVLFVGFSMGSWLGAISILIGYYVIDKAKKEYSFPFSLTENECLIISEEGFQFIYHNTTNPQMDSKEVYSVLFKDITYLEIEGKVLTYRSKSDFVAYKNFDRKVVDDVLTEAFALDENFDFKILLAFDESDEIIEKLQRRK